jgi:hypothetical protein
LRMGVPWPRRLVGLLEGPLQGLCSGAVWDVAVWDVAVWVVAVWDVAVGRGRGTWPCVAHGVWIYGA